VCPGWGAADGRDHDRNPYTDDDVAQHDWRLCAGRLGSGTSTRRALADDVHSAYVMRDFLWDSIFYGLIFGLNFLLHRFQRTDADRRTDGW
jgi:hypothetical protein